MSRSHLAWLKVIVRSQIITESIFLRTSTNQESQKSRLTLARFRWLRSEWIELSGRLTSKCWFGFIYLLNTWHTVFYSTKEIVSFTRAEQASTHAYGYSCQRGYSLNFPGCLPSMRFSTWVTSCWVFETQRLESATSIRFDPARSKCSVSEVWKEKVVETTLTGSRIEATKVNKVLSDDPHAEMLVLQVDLFSIFARISINPTASILSMRLNPCQLSSDLWHALGAMQMMPVRLSGLSTSSSHQMEHAWNYCACFCSWDFGFCSSTAWITFDSHYSLQTHCLAGLRK